MKTFILETLTLILPFTTFPLQYRVLELKTMKFYPIFW